MLSDKRLEEFWIVNVRVDNGEALWQHDVLDFKINENKEVVSTILVHKPSVDGHVYQDVKRGFHCVSAAYVEQDMERFGNISDHIPFTVTEVFSSLCARYPKLNPRKRITFAKALELYEQTQHKAEVLTP